MGNMETAPHPQPAYWFEQGRRYGRAGCVVIDTDDYGRIFADPEPDQVWIDAFHMGMRQGQYDVLVNGWLYSPQVRRSERRARIRALLQRFTCWTSMQYRNALGSGTGKQA